MSARCGGAVLFLTNNKNTEPLKKWLESQGENVVEANQKLAADFECADSFKFALSFNYRHILSQKIIESLNCPIVNIHCSMLPWNRGANPNFFSYYENTPKGVTVHKLTAGLDKGEILLQKSLDLSESETFRSSYAKLIDCAINLIKNNWEILSNNEIKAYPQIGKGSYHSSKDFETISQRYPFEWDDRIDLWKERYGLH